MKNTIDEKLKNKLKSNNKILDNAQKIILKIMKLRNKFGLTQNQLATKSGISHTSIARIENFIMQPTLKMLLQILDVYGMTLDVVPQNSYIQTSIKSWKSYDIDKTNLSELKKQEKIKFNEVITFINENVTLHTSCDNNYSEFLNSIFLNYSRFLKEKNADKQTRDGVERFGKYVQLILSEYYRGQHNTAYFLFKEVLDSCINIELFFQNVSENTVFYRCRHRKKHKLKEEDFYHIPFDKRYSVSTQRYSFPGLPCLYLGSSKEVCALEFKSNLEDIAIARIEYKSNNEKYRIFDLTSIFFKYVENQESFCTSDWLKCIPLYLICSTYIDYDKDSIGFKQEYIFSQLLLEYIINESTLSRNSVIGLKYFSVHTDIWNVILNKDVSYLHSICNYVFPARDIKSNDNHCGVLNNHFEVTDIL